MRGRRVEFVGDAGLGEDLERRLDARLIAFGSYENEDIRHSPSPSAQLLDPASRRVFENGVILPALLRRVPRVRDQALHLGECGPRSEEHTSELQSLRHLVCRLLLEKKKKKYKAHVSTYRVYRIEAMIRCVRQHR